jgi:cell division septum initiation protein DivIVA
MESENRIKDPVQQFLELRENLQKERSALVEKVQQIDEVLASSTIESKIQLGSKRLKQPRQKRNEMSLKEAVIKITSKAPKTKDEILSELDSMGYVFSSATPINSLNATLYSKGQFNNNKGYFSPQKH